jgi:D-alanyl-D-alanine endopeptidase (penicillin-binding protein 7)
MHAAVTRKAGTPSPAVTARAAVSIDAGSGQVLYQKNPQQVRSLASLTKLMTALVFLDHNPDWSKTITMERDDNVGGATVDLRPGEQVSVRDLFAAMLIGSKNNAVLALVRASGLSQVDFVAEMNERAAALKLSQTRFVEPTGLDARNVSTALDYARLSQAALQKNEIRWFTSLPMYRFQTRNTGRLIDVHNTNRLVRGRYFLQGGKTGFTDEAGYCLVTYLKNQPRGRAEVINVVMGDSRYQFIFDDTSRLADWVFASHVWY